MSVTKVTRGGRPRWDVRWREEGRQRSRTFDLRKDAERFEQDTRRRLQQGAHGTAEPSTDTLTAWIDEWWELKAHEWARSTRVQREHLLRKWVDPWIGGVRLRDLGSHRIDRWQADLHKAGCTPLQRNQAIRVLSAVLGAAVKARKLPSNPCQGKTAVLSTARRVRALTPAEIEAVRDAMAVRDAAIVSLMAYAGLRPEEVLALQWGDIRDGMITVQRARTYGETKGTKSGGIRDVPIVPPLADDLDQLRPPGALPADLVAPGAGGYLDLNNWRSRSWAPAAVAAGFTETRTTKTGKTVTAATIVPYDCRHTYASLRLHEGTPLFTVAGEMGHASLRLIERTYGHIYQAARLKPRQPMVDAILEARFTDPDVRSECDTGNVVDLTAVRQRRKTA